jgi:lipopolysaccharide/colanic/teichoic acid biosynthesis glycosyltransferase
MTMQPNEISSQVPTTAAPVGLVFLPEKPGPYRRYFKRALDLALVVVGSIIAVPLVALIALMVMTDGANPFYASERVGRHGRVFRMIKLRTMVADADERLEGYLSRNPAAQSEWDATQKLKDDPRITRFGRFLRKSSLDELPQLWNVFVGDMALVGPRPMMPNQRMIYSGVAYYTLRPGMTGLWQISDRNNCTFVQRAAIDEEYDSRVTLATDLAILFKTVMAVAKGTGY